MHLIEVERILSDKIFKLTQGEDPAHDFLHFLRVVRTAKQIAQEERADLAVVVPAAWLHDLINVPKDDPRRAQASRMSAEAAVDFLKQIHYPAHHLDAIAHAITAHSFSAGVRAETLEARVVQDADRLDGLGAIGIARCFASAGVMRRSFYEEQDPFCERGRAVDDRRFTVDHFYAKLFQVAETLQTPAGRAEGARRVQVMRRFLKDLGGEI